jgi:hypothetical protein
MSRRIVLLASVALLSHAVWFATPKAQAATGTQWEYLELAWAYTDVAALPHTQPATLHACRLTAETPECRTFPEPGREHGNAVAALGIEGWELVTVLKDDMGAGDFRRWIFKRPLAVAK